MSICDAYANFNHIEIILTQIPNKKNFFLSIYLKRKINLNKYYSYG